MITINKKRFSTFFAVSNLMSQINWKILNLEYPSDDEMLFHFLVDDTEFFTIINFNELYTEHYQEFSIQKPGIKDFTNVNYETVIAVKKDEINILAIPERIEIASLNRFFNKKKIERKNLI